MIIFNNHLFIIKSTKSIIFVLLTELPEVDLSVAKSTELQIASLYLGFVHLVSTGFAPVVASAGDGLSRNYAGREIAAARSATGVILTH